MIPMKTSATDEQVNASCERHMVAMLRSILDELEVLGMDHIEFAGRARHYLSRYDAYVADCSEPLETLAPLLRLVNRP